jgi:diguanylate cyclase (GGDEF)-like protein/PAS domain S-box-containing protein
MHERSKNRVDDSNQVHELSRPGPGEARLAKIIDQAPIGVHVFAPDGTSILTNRVWDELWTLDVNPHRANIFEDEQVRAAGLLRYVEECIESNRSVETPPLHFDPKTVERAGRERWLRAFAYPTTDERGRVEEVSLLLEDVTERVEKDIALEESEERLKTVVTGMPVILFTLDEEGVIETVKGRGFDALNLDARNFLGHSVRDLARDPGGLAAVNRALSGEEVVSEISYEDRIFETRYSPTTGEDGKQTGVIGVAIDVTERKRLEEKLSYQALHDDLTGLANRTLLSDRVSHALAWAGRRKSKVAVLFMDVDNFKFVNDTLGHGAGDRLLIEVATRIKASVRPGDTVARPGGDEFAVLLEEVEGTPEAEVIAERIARELRSPCHFEGHELFITVSIGIAVDDGGERAADLLREADAAMYHGKEEGKDRRVTFRPSMSGRWQERLEMETNLRRAIEREELTVHYQPMIRAGTREIFGAEALVRWEHPERGLVSPAEFVPLAEETGLISQIGARVLREACEKAKRWREQFLTPFEISVNVSARQFRRTDFVEDVSKALAESGLEAGALTLEITETTAMGDAPAALSMLRRLRNLGVKIAMDDFGTGYSSLSYLRHFPMDSIKIDRSLVKNLEPESQNSAIILSVVMLSHAMGLAVTAEGVETEDEYAEIRDLDCDSVQGFFFYRPMPAEEFEETLARNSRVGASKIRASDA